MVIIICGPPHSGKSVFVANLVNNLPSDKYTVIRACPDGEGTWSNNENQKYTQLVREKGKFSKEFIQNTCETIDKQENPIVLVDVGGIRSAENEEIFKHCDSYIVVSSNEYETEEWKKFGNNLGLGCSGILVSSLEGNEEIYFNEPYVSGKIVGLERGTYLKNSKLLNSLVSSVIKKTEYFKQKTDKMSDIEDIEIGFELGCGEIINTDGQNEIKKVKWKESVAPQLYKHILNKSKGLDKVNINGVRANWVLPIIVRACKENNISDINTYDVRTTDYIKIKQLEQKDGLQECSGLKFNIVENEKHTFLDVDVVNEIYKTSDYEKCIIPKIDENKSILISGRLPLWLSTSISNSYNSKEKFMFQPGRGFICIDSEEKEKLGQLIDPNNFLNLEEYFMKKKELKSNTKSEKDKFKDELVKQVVNVGINSNIENQKEENSCKKNIVKGAI